LLLSLTRESALSLVVMVMLATLLVGLAFFMQWRSRFLLVDRYRRDSYDVAREQDSFPDNPDDAAPTFGTGANSANVVSYGVGDPFVGFGVRMNSWQVAVDATRPADPNGPAPRRFDLDEIYAFLSKSVNDLAIPNLQMEDLLFVNGSETPQIKDIQAGRLVRPKARLDAATMQKYLHGVDARARAYRCLRITDWNGELVFTYLFRCVQRGEALAVESVQLVLPPIAREFREIDHLRLLGFFGMVQWGIGALIATPFVIVAAFGSIGQQIREAVWALFGGFDGRERKEISRNRAYNYGARESIREAMAARDFHVFFQRVDAFQYMRAIDQQITNALIDQLRAAGVDVATLGAQQQTIVNNGVIVGGAAQITGGVNVAGAGGAVSTSTIQNVVARATPRAARS
jgi:hypothetical protein